MILSRKSFILVWISHGQSLSVNTELTTKCSHFREVSCFKCLMLTDWINLSHEAPTTFYTLHYSLLKQTIHSRLVPRHIFWQVPDNLQYWKYSLQILKENLSNLYLPAPQHMSRSTVFLLKPHNFCTAL